MAVGVPRSHDDRAMHMPGEASVAIGDGKGAKGKGRGKAKAKAKGKAKGKGNGQADGQADPAPKVKTAMQEAKGVPRLKINAIRAQVYNTYTHTLYKDLDPLNSSPIMHPQI